MEYEIRLLPEFEEWLDGLKDRLAQEAVAERLIRASRGNFGDHKTVNDGVSELRIRYGGGYRAYYTIRGRTILFMLVGGTKRTQDRDIARAKRLAKLL
jgi:putative addiction module killer protein